MSGDIVKWSHYWQCDFLPPWDSEKPCSHLVNLLEQKEFMQIEINNALEFGCGSGRNCIYMQTLGNNNVTGVDIVPEAIEICKKNQMYSMCKRSLYQAL